MTAGAGWEPHSPRTLAHTQYSHCLPAEAVCQVFGLVCGNPSQGWLPAVRFIPCEGLPHTRPSQSLRIGIVEPRVTRLKGPVE